MKGDYTTMNEKEIQEIQIKDNLSRIKQRIVVLSGKGGVGKSFVATNIAYGLALQGKTVGILDADIHGPSVAKLTNIEGKKITKHPIKGVPTPIKALSNLYVLSVASILTSENDALIWRGPLKMTLIRQFFSDFYWEELDYLVVDCPPGTGDEPLSIVQTLGRVDGAIVVTTPQDLAILDVKKSINFLHQLHVPILGIVENMKYFRCPHCNELTNIFDGNQLKKLVAQHGIDILAELELDPNISISSDEGKPYVYYYSKQPSAQRLLKATVKIMDKLADK